MKQATQALEEIQKCVEELPLISGVVVGILMKLTKSGDLFVEHRSNPTASLLSSRSIVALTEDDLGKEVVLMFEGGHPSKPIIMGLLQRPEMVATPIITDILSQKDKPIEAKLDGERVVLTAEKEIVLKCGHASLTLTKAGRILLRGTYVLSRSSGVNKVKGGSVEIN